MYSHTQMYVYVYTCIQACIYTGLLIQMYIVARVGFFSEVYVDNYTE